MGALAIEKSLLSFGDISINNFYKLRTKIYCLQISHPLINLPKLRLGKIKCGYRSILTQALLACKIALFTSTVWILGRRLGADSRSGELSWGAAAKCLQYLAFSLLE